MTALIPFSSNLFNDPTDLLFKDFFNTDSIFDSVIDKKLSYPVDIRETDNGLRIEIAAIGLDKEDIKIETKDGNVIQVSHEKSKEKEGNHRLYSGISRKSFNLAWKISPKFDLSKISANLDKGLLSIDIPVAPEKKPKLIDIK